MCYINGFPLLLLRQCTSPSPILLNFGQTTWNKMSRHITHINSQRYEEITHVGLLRETLIFSWIQMKWPGHLSYMDWRFIFCFVSVQLYKHIFQMVGSLSCSCLDQDAKYVQLRTKITSPDLTDKSVFMLHKLPPNHGYCITSL